MDSKAQRLMNGESFKTKAFGNSMTPLLNSGQEHYLEPLDWRQARIGDILYCKVKGRYYTHLVHAIDKVKGVQIGNNKGRINGWTKQVYGRVIGGQQKM